MSEGPGRYDDLASHVREQTNAETVVLIVIPSETGRAGFSVQSTDHEFQASLPALLRCVADEIEKGRPA